MILQSNQPVKYKLWQNTISLLIAYKEIDRF
jgi:hypothetical protein